MLSSHMSHPSVSLSFRLALALASFVSPHALAAGPDAGAPPAGAAASPPGGGGWGFGPGGPGGFLGKTAVVDRFDTNGDRRLDATERKAAREALAKERPAGRMRPGGFPPGGPGGGFPPGGPGGGFPPGGPGGAFPGGPPPFPTGNQEPPKPGKPLAPSQVKAYPRAPLYDTSILRTLFLTFDDPQWEEELSAFARTDVEVPAKLLVDGRAYDEVGVRFRGMSSLMMVGPGRKKSLNLTLDAVNRDQRLGGYRTLNLLNANGDPTFMRGVLFLEIARRYIPAPKANFVRVVVNGEHRGIYVNAQQFNKDFTSEHFGSGKGARWKVPGRPNGDGGLRYLGPDVAEYKRRYTIKTKDDPTDWAALIELTRVLDQSPPEELEAALDPLLDIDGTLRFLALDNVFINEDGYWSRASDYNLFRDDKGRFHIIPHDANETFLALGGPGHRPDETKGADAAVALDPLVAVGDARKPLYSKLLAVPTLRAKYLGYVRQIATEALDWRTLGPIAQRYQKLIAADVAADTRKLFSTEAFRKGVTADHEEPGFRGPRKTIGIKTFVERRRAYLLDHPAIRGATANAAR
jgi:hypothetical protein